MGRFDGRVGGEDIARSIGLWAANSCVGDVSINEAFILLMLIFDADVPGRRTGGAVTPLSGLKWINVISDSAVDGLLSAPASRGSDALDDASCAMNGSGGELSDARSGECCVSDVVDADRSF